MIYFSCIVTCYNRAKVISRAIQSILTQTYQHFEIIVVDDHSSDDSAAVINAIGDNRIVLVKHEKNQGQNAALNTGVAHARYPYLAFLDSDDEWLGNYLEEMSKLYATWPEIGFAYTDLFGIESPLEGVDKYADVLNQGTLSAMIAVTAKKESVLKIGGFDVQYKVCQDEDFCFRLARQYSFKITDTALAIIHPSPDSMTNNYLDIARGWERLFLNYKRDILNLCGSKSYSRHLLKVASWYFRCNSISKGLWYYISGLWYYVRPAYNKYPFSVSSFIQASNYNIGLCLRSIRYNI